MSKMSGSKICITAFAVAKILALPTAKEFMTKQRQ
jgi:hypothetical protein